MYYLYRGFADVAVLVGREIEVYWCSCSSRSWKKLKYADVAQPVEQPHGGPQAPPIPTATSGRIPNYGQ